MKHFAGIAKNADEKAAQAGKYIYRSRTEIGLRYICAQGNLKLPQMYRARICKPFEEPRNRFPA
jgi:hypothetical protein